MTVLVTGGAGFVGGNLVRALLDRGSSVRVTLRADTRAVDGLDVERFFVDVTKPETLSEAMQGVDVVYNTAGVISIDGDPDGAVTRTNVDGTRNVLEAASNAGVRRVVHFGSVHAADDDEDDAPAYDRSKALGDAEVRAAVERGVDALVVAPAAILGPYDFKPSRIGQVLLDLYHRRLPALVAGGYDWVDVRDVCDGAIAAAERGKTGASYVLGGTYEPVSVLAAIAEQITGVAPPKLLAPRWLAAVGAPFVTAFARATNREPLYTKEALRALRRTEAASSAPAQNDLGYRARPLEESVRDTYDWFRAAGRLEARS